MTRFSLRYRLVAAVSPRGGRHPGRSLGGRGAAAVLALCLLGESSRAGEEWVDAEPPWIPSLRFGFDTFHYQTQASVRNGLNPPEGEGTQNDVSRLLMLQFGGELMGPMLDEWPGRPRLFAQGGAQWSPFSSDGVFQLGVPGDTRNDVVAYQGSLANSKHRGCVAIGSCPPLPADFIGEGSDIDAKFKSPSWNAALGVAFSLPLAESLLLQVRPLIAYNLERIELSGTITTVFDTGETFLVRSTLPPFPATMESVPRLLVVRGAASQTITQHSLGPGLELDLALFRSIRPVRTSLYADVRFLWLLGDRNTTFSDSVATYEVRRDAFAIRGGAGVRFSWMGLGER